MVNNKDLPPSPSTGYLEGILGEMEEEQDEKQEEQHKQEQFLQAARNLEITLKSIGWVEIIQPWFDEQKESNLNKAMQKADHQGLDSEIKVALAKASLIKEFQAFVESALSEAHNLATSTDEGS